MPVFLLYAGILHAIGLALLLPMLITLPGPAGEPTPALKPTPEIAPIDVIVLPPPQALRDAPSWRPRRPRPRQALSAKSPRAPSPRWKRAKAR